MMIRICNHRHLKPYPHALPLIGHILRPCQASQATSPRSPVRLLYIRPNSILHRSIQALLGSYTNLPSSQSPSSIPPNPYLLKTQAFRYDLPAELGYQNLHCSHHRQHP